MRPGGHGGQVAIGEYVSGQGTHLVPAMHGRTGVDGTEPLDALGDGTAVFDLATALDDADALALVAAIAFPLNCELETVVEHAARSVTATSVVGTSGLMPRNQRAMDR